MSGPICSSIWTNYNFCGRHALALEVTKMGLHATNLQKAKFLERSNSLRRKIEAWISVQQLHIPSIAPLRFRDDAAAAKPVAVQDIKLFLPSFLPRSIDCPILFLRYEWDFRYAQAEETLNELRGVLILQSHMLKSKNRYVRGQRQMTRSAKLLDNVQQKVHEAVARYRRIRTALETLSPLLLNADWGNTLRVLDDADVKGLTSMDNSASEGRKRLSWIWKVHGTSADADECTQAGRFLQFYLSVMCLNPNIK